MSDDQGESVRKGATQGDEARAFQLAHQAEVEGAKEPSSSTSKQRQQAAPKDQRVGPSRRKKGGSTRIPMETDLDRQFADQIAKNLKLEEKLSLRRLIAIFAIAAVSVQLVSASLLFWGYLAWPHWRIGTPTQVVIAWLSATVVEVIGIVVIIAKNLFPGNEKTITRAQMKELLRRGAR